VQNKPIENPTKKSVRNKSDSVHLVYKNGHLKKVKYGEYLMAIIHAQNFSVAAQG